jgi:hypothetical protein
MFIPDVSIDDINIVSNVNAVAKWNRIRFNV